MKEYTIKQAMEQTLAAPDGMSPAFRFSRGDARQVLAALDAPRAPMTEDEILQRARRACAGDAAKPSEWFTGLYDTGFAMQSVMRALRDLNKPIVDPVVLACREIVAALNEYHPRYRKALRDGAPEADDSDEMKAAIAAYRAGQEAARGK